MMKHKSANTNQKINEEEVEDQDPDYEPISENDPDTRTISGDHSNLFTSPSPKKSNKGVPKKVMSVPISDVEESKSKGDAYPPSDSWAWRKYGQKPIKGSPYRRGYYRCSSSKGCPAKKQVERSHADPTMLIITYAHDHNHPRPTTKFHPSSSSTSCSSPSSAATSSPHNPTTSAASVPTAKFHEDELAPVAAMTSQEDLMLKHDSKDFVWFTDVAYESVLEIPIYEESNRFAGPDVELILSMKEDDVDDSLFGDLEELPECSVVFRRRAVQPNDLNQGISNTNLVSSDC